MKHKKNLFLVLEKIEQKKIEIQAIKIKNLYLDQKELCKQLELIRNYQKEYIIALYNKMIFGINIYTLKNYNNFISVLKKIIEKNEKIIEKNKKIIHKSFIDFNKSKTSLKIWEYLNIKQKKHILRSKKIQEQNMHDTFSQWKHFS